MAADNTPDEAPPSSSDNAGRPSRWRRRPSAARVVIGLLVLFGLIQLIPYGRDHENPPSTVGVAWASTNVEKLAMKHCADCHSNMTKWPGYTNVAPLSWLVQSDVTEGRQHLNWSVGCGEIDDVGEVVANGEMPPLQYKLKHGFMTETERSLLAEGIVDSLEATPGMTGRPCTGSKDRERGERGGEEGEVGERGEE